MILLLLPWAKTLMGHAILAASLSFTWRQAGRWTGYSERCCTINTMVLLVQLRLWRDSNANGACNCGSRTRAHVILGSALLSGMSHDNDHDTAGARALYDNNTVWACHPGGLRVSNIKACRVTSSHRSLCRFVPNRVVKERFVGDLEITAASRTALPGILLRSTQITRQWNAIKTASVWPH